MALRFLTLTPRITRRLNSEVFNGPSKKVYGDGVDRLEREQRFASIRSALVHLLYHQHYPYESMMGNGIEKIRNDFERLMSHPDVGQIFTPERQQHLKGLMKNLIETGQQELNPHYDAGDVERFVEMATVGRAHYENQGYDPEGFISKQILAFANIISGNFESWRATLNHEYVSADS